MFISDLRACRTREQETQRINKELANIRSNFKDVNLNGYQKKKYVAKLAFMFILGHDIDFGHLEAISLISCSVYSEKSIVSNCTLKVGIFGSDSLCCSATGIYYFNYFCY